MTEVYLPDVYVRLRERFPEVAETVDALGRATAAAGPLDERTQRLVKLGIAMGALAEGAVRSNARRALEAGASEEEILHVAALTITTRGFPAAIAAFPGSKRCCQPSNEQLVPLQLFVPISSASCLPMLQAWPGSTPARAASQQEIGAAVRSDACAATPASSRSCFCSSSLGATMPSLCANCSVHSPTVTVMTIDRSPQARLHTYPRVAGTM